MIIHDLNEAHRYCIIYADPPWAYRDKRGGKPRFYGLSYSTMPTHHDGWNVWGNEVKDGGE